MAKFLSQVYTVIRGSVGGITYTANQFQALIARARVSPVNPNTVRQTLIRSAFSGAEQLWQNLTDLARQGWEDYADTLVFTGPTGNYSVPGRQVFVGNIATAIYLNGVLGSPVAIVTTPPVIPGFLNLDAVNSTTFITPASTGIALTATQNGAEDVVLYAGRSFAFNPSRNRFKGPMLSQTLASVTIAAPGSAILAFAGLAVDMIYFTNPRGITAQAPFRQSAPFFLRHIAETNI